MPKTELSTSKNQLSVIVEKQTASLRKALPSHIKGPSFVRSLQTQLRLIPKLQECTPLSFLSCAYQIAQLGLTPSPLLGECYLIPRRKNEKRGTEWIERYLCSLVIGYKGLISLATRGGNVLDISTDAVYEKDDFTLEKGTHPKCINIPFDGEDRGEFRGAYAVATMKNGFKKFEYMSRHEINKIRDKSDGYLAAIKPQGEKSTWKKPSSPWITDYDEMAKKTVIRRLCKTIPFALELQQAISLDEIGDRSLSMQGEHMQASIPEGEILDAQSFDSSEPSSASENLNKILE